jgi:hypothetical protein
MLLVVNLLDIPSISAIVAATSVVLSAAFAVIQLRNMTKNNQTEFLIRLQSVFMDREYRKAWATIRECKPTEYKDCLKAEPEYELVLAFFDNLGILLHRNLVNSDLIQELFGASINRAWERSKIYIEGARNEVKDPELWAGFEYLYKQIGQKTTHFD